MDDDGWWRWMIVDDDGWWWMNMGEDGWRWMKMDENGWWRMMKMDDDRWWWMKKDEDGWIWRKMDGDGWWWMKMDDSRWWWMKKMEEDGGKWRKMDEDGWRRWMKMDEDGGRWMKMKEWMNMDDDGWRWMKTQGDNDDDVFMSDPSIAQRPIGYPPSRSASRSPIVSQEIDLRRLRGMRFHHIEPWIEQLGPTGHWPLPPWHDLSKFTEKYGFTHGSWKMICKSGMFNI